MPRCTADDATVHIYTYKAGLLSAVGHDLLLRVTDFTVDIDPDDESIRGSFRADSIEVVYALADGKPNDKALSDDDRKTILKYLNKDILKSATYPTVDFASSDVFAEDDEVEVEGDLTLCGTTRSITVTAAVEDDMARAEIVLNQPSFGIKPFTAMLGALKIQPDVRVVIAVPLATLAELG